MVAEEAVRFGRSLHLVGVISLPAAQRADCAVIFLNAGLVPRVGPHRLHVRLARLIAAQGIPSLRFDFAGIGDSSHADSGVAANFSADVSDAVKLLGSRLNVKRIVLFGICAGAVRAYESTLAEPKVAGAILVDGYLYTTWKTSWVYLARRLAAEFPYISLLGRKLRRLTAPRPSSQSEDRLVFETGTIAAEQYAAGLATLAERGTSVLHIMTGSFPTRYNHETQFEDRFRPFGLGQKISAAYMPCADHTFSTYALQAELAQRITDFVRGNPESPI
jgi:pimeloyl-ACP methyl ester carboxylesterase